MSETLAVYTVNCARHKQILISGTGAKRFDVIACQELDQAASEEGYNRVAQGIDEHNLNVSIFLDIGKPDPSSKTRPRHSWHQIDGKGLHLPTSYTGRAIAVAAIGHETNRNFEVWIASIHGKSGQQFKKSAQTELNEALNYLFTLGRSAGPKAIILTGDMNWASVNDWANDYADTFKKYYKGKTWLGKDQLSGRSLMQTIVLYSEDDVVGKPDLKDGPRTAEGHVTLHAEIQFANIDNSGKRRKT
jgi:hypothetical protein